MSAAAADDLAGVPLFADLEPDEREALASWFEIQEVSADVKLTGECGPGFSFFVLREGTATVTIDGNVVRTLESGDFFGEARHSRRRPAHSHGHDHVAGARCSCSSEPSSGSFSRSIRRTRRADRVAATLRWPPRPRSVDGSGCNSPGGRRDPLLPRLKRIRPTGRESRGRAARNTATTRRRAEGAKSQYDVVVDGETIFSKQALRRWHPEDGEIVAPSTPAEGPRPVRRTDVPLQGGPLPGHPRSVKPTPEEARCTSSRSPQSPSLLDARHVCLDRSREGRRGHSQVVQRGQCSAASHSKLKAKRDDSRLETEFEVDQDRAGQRWRVTITRNRSTVFRGIGRRRAERLVRGGAPARRRCRGHIIATAKSLSGARDLPRIGLCLGSSPAPGGDSVSGLRVPELAQVVPSPGAACVRSVTPICWKTRVRCVLTVFSLMPRLARDQLVRHPVRDAAKDFALALGQCGALADGAGAEDGARRLRIERRLAASSCSDACDQSLGLRVLEEVADRAGVERREDALAVGERRPAHDDLNRVVRREDHGASPRSRRRSASRRSIRTTSGADFGGESNCARRRRLDHLDVVGCCEQPLETGAHEAVVLRQQDADHLAIPRPRPAPPPGEDSTSRLALRVAHEVRQHLQAEMALVSGSRRVRAMAIVLDDEQGTGVGRRNPARSVTRRPHA